MQVVGRFLDQQMEMYPASGVPQQNELFDLQYKCQYMSGLNFYDLKPLANK
jgi:hypothetical protein